ncbi:flippase [Pyrococcus abyssi]|uniref:Polysaccharide biosynthesis related protein n=1 Tax=Pyrococcus abyssi (strain GE5 / Orsay) TaxID=272844 RepID=Q9UZH4_PYRAB|nr:flippase [Pyrococcus abyssi]CAB50085.1 Polysaccharide biosynthesis related protein, substrate unknown [Pyrococcus abyssi GE5]CCE70599.1 TPA: polysaccharide biosynthesis related protein [Pyrococcus abyssi GE5]
MSSEVTQALARIARGTGIIFAGTLISTFLGFITRVLIARHFSESDYGVFNLALTILTISFIVATLGFPTSLPREIPVYREKYPEKVNRLISTVILVVVATSIILMAFLFLGSQAIAEVFKEPKLVEPLKVISLALPFYALTSMLVSISQGFGRVREKVYFTNITYPTLFLAFATLGVIFGKSIKAVVIAYTLSWVVTLFLIVWDYSRVKIFTLELTFDLNIAKSLLTFSLPLLLSGILGFVMTWTDTLMIGYYLTSREVGIYNSATPLAKMLPIFLASFSYLYMPISSQLYAQGKVKEMGRVYQMTTKWTFLLTLPMFLMLVLFPQATISFIFGEKYLDASVALQILAIGFMFHTFLGLNGLTLVIIGESKLNMIGDLIAALSNILLNIALIPFYGVNGAAFATSVSYIVANFFRSFWLYRKTGIHPFTKNYLKPLGIGVLLVGMIKAVHLNVGNIWYALILLGLILVVYSLLVLVVKSLDREDLELMLEIEKKLGLNLGILKNFLKRFAQ